MLISYMNKHYSLLFLLLVFSYFSSSQNIGSEKRILNRITELRQRSDYKAIDTTHIKLLYDLAVDIRHSNTDSMLMLITEAQKLSLKSKYYKGMGLGYLRLADYYGITNDFDKAKELYARTMELSGKYDLLNVKVIAYNNLGVNYILRGRIGDALIEYLQAIELAKKAKNYRMLAILQSNLAIIYSNIGKNEKALGLHKKGLEISRKIQNKTLMGQALSNMGQSYIHLNQFEKAHKVIDEAILIFLAENKKDWLSFCYELRGRIALAKMKYRNALESYSIAKDYNDQVNQFTAKNSIRIGLAKSNLGLNDLWQAEQIAFEAYTDAKLNTSDFEIEEAAFVLASIYNKKKDFEEAFKFQQEYIEVHEKLQTDKLSSSLDIFRGKKEFEKQKKEIIQAKNLEIVQQKAQKNYALLAILIALLLATLSFSFYRTQKKHNENLRAKQSKLVKSERDLQHSNQTKNKLFNVIAHDLKGPLNSFYDFMKMYSEGDLSKEETETALPVAINNLGAINEMLNNLLQWGQSQMKGATTAPEYINIYDLSVNNVALLKPLADKKSIGILNTIPSDFVGYLDKNDIDVVFRNLISNAIKFTPNNGSILLNAVIKNENLQISIQDTGIGMTLKEQQNLFSKEVNTSTYGTNNEKGTGLGLSLCKNMVEKNKGKIWLTSSEISGTTFYFTIPQKSAKEFMKAV